MKKTLLISICFIMIMSLTLPVHTQEAKEFNTKKIEVNIGVSDIFAKNNIIYPYYYIDGDYYLQYVYNDYYRKPELLVGIKFHNDKGAFRLGTNFNFNNITTKDSNGNNEKSEFKTFSSKLNLGYEWHSTISRIVIYYGLDISTSYSNSYFKNEYSTNFEQIVNESTLNEFTVGVNPLIGTAIFITPNLSIGTEVKFTAEYVSGKTIDESSGSPNTNETESSGIRTHFGPIGFLSINLHF